MGGPGGFPATLFPSVAPSLLLAQPHLKHPLAVPQFPHVKREAEAGGLGGGCCRGLLHPTLDPPAVGQSTVAVKDRAISSGAGGQCANSLPTHRSALCPPWHPLISSCTGYGAAHGHCRGPSASGISPARPAPGALAGAAGWHWDGCRDSLPTPSDSAPGKWVLALPHSQAWGEAARKWPLLPPPHWTCEGPSSTIKQ